MFNWELVVTYCFIAITFAAFTAQSGRASDPGEAGPPVFRAVAIRYQVKDVEASVVFYTKNLGFKLDQKAGTAFARISNGNYVLWLSGPGSSGSRPMPDGRKQEPGGWNRLAIEVDDLATCVREMERTGVRFRNQIESGPGGKQIQLEDPDGNPVELFQPAS